MCFFFLFNFQSCMSLELNFQLLASEKFLNKAKAHTKNHSADETKPPLSDLLHRKALSILLLDTTAFYPIVLDASQEGRSRQ